MKLLQFLSLLATTIVIPHTPATALEQTSSAKGMERGKRQDLTPWRVREKESRWAKGKT
ncbi:hypothetical protein [Ferrigenium sp. UT5]|uniref:hypothetical protein n=1 Tax=Ferrigenium sp. UT5 TaxID=3242105 RepID=UPI0038B3C58B